MAGRSSQIEHIAAISRVVQVGPHASAYRSHLSDILTSQAFKGSRRSQEFLHHIVEKALQGHFDELKERAIGVELFGRSATYDTGEDAIVRVTASDVRRRLLQFYVEAGSNSEMRIDLPSGSYIPEFRQIPSTPPPQLPPNPEPALPSTAGSRRNRLLDLGIFALGGLVVWGLFSLWGPRLPNLRYVSVSPWSTMFDSERQTRLIFCDPDISKAQGLLNFRISLSDYANHRYLPEAANLNPDTNRLIQQLRGVDVAAVDTAIALNISEIALRNSGHLKTNIARTMQLGDFKTDDNFILLGSPRSNPWATLFDDKLGFRFEYDAGLGQEIVRVANTRPGETDRYIPTAQGWATGQAYGIVAFLANPGQRGHVLLIAGSNAEATEAAGRFVANPDQVTKVLKNHAIDPTGLPVHFEALLKVSIMAGSSNTYEVISVHKLPGNS